MKFTSRVGVDLEHFWHFQTAPAVRSRGSSGNTFIVDTVSKNNTGAPNILNTF